MPQFITTTEGVRINPRFIYEYGQETPDTTFVRDGYGKHITTLSLEELDRITQKAADTLTEKDCTTINRLIRKLDEHQGAITRMPTNVHVKF